MGKQCKFVKAHGIRCDNVTVFKDGICKGHKKCFCHLCDEQAIRECGNGVPPHYCGNLLCKRCKCSCGGSS